MVNDSKAYEIFKNGGAWVRADLHLHTKADKEFRYDGEENGFINAYVQQMKKLDKFTKEYFLIFAHVEADNGLWGGLAGDGFRN